MDRYKARAMRAVAEPPSKNGNDSIRILFAFTEGPRAGEEIGAWRYLTDKALKGTVADLRTCGWKGDDLDDLSGIDGSVEVQIAIDVEEYLGKQREKVKFIDPPDRRVGGSASEGLGAKWRDKIAALANGGGAGSNEPDPFDEAIRRHQKPA